MDNSRPPFLDVAKRALAKHYPGAIGGFVAGSVIRGEGTPTSDIDIAVLFDESFEDVHRNSVVEEGWPIEFFVHNPQAQDFYFDKDRKRGMCIMPTMVANGIIIPDKTDLLLAQRCKAATIIAAGPPLLAKDDCDLRRYMIADLLDDLEGASDAGTRRATLALLHEHLGDFHLRARGCWSGRGKSLLKRLKEEDEDYAARYGVAFESGFSAQNIAPVMILAEETLAPRGGRLWEGYRSAAPDTWKKFEGGQT